MRLQSLWLSLHVHFVHVALPGLMKIRSEYEVTIANNVSISFQTLALNAFPLSSFFVVLCLFDVG